MTKSADVVSGTSTEYDSNSRMRPASSGAQPHSAKLPICHGRLSVGLRPRAEEPVVPGAGVPAPGRNWGAPAWQFRSSIACWPPTARRSVASLTCLPGESPAKSDSMRPKWAPIASRHPARLRRNGVALPPSGGLHNHRACHASPPSGPAA
jgi:hypothetical protein